MSTELAIVGQQPSALAVPQGLGYTGNSRLLSAGPATLGIVQPSSTLEGGKKGHFIVDNDPDTQFESMRVAFLLEPTEHRQYYIGEPGELNRSPENLHCFCNDVTRQLDPATGREVETSVPDKKAKYPQAVTCAGCAKGSWKQFRDKQDKGIATTKADIPPCELSYQAYLIDTVLKMPLRLFVRSQSKDPFEQGLKRIARKLDMLAAIKGTLPNIFDVSFKLSTKLVEKGKYKFYVLQITDVQGIDDEERVKFGAVFNKITEQIARRAAYAEAEATEKAASTIIAEAEGSIDAAVTGDNNVIEGEYEETNADGEVKL